jgi:hypothetical protein
VKFLFLESLLEELLFLTCVFFLVETFNPCVGYTMSIGSILIIVYVYKDSHMGGNMEKSGILVLSIRNPQNSLHDHYSISIYGNITLYLVWSI